VRRHDEDHEAPYIEAMRAMLYTNRLSIDAARPNNHDQAEREARPRTVELLTPISKAWCTDLAGRAGTRSACRSRGEWATSGDRRGKYLRDRDRPIYEGTNSAYRPSTWSWQGPECGAEQQKQWCNLLDQMVALDGELAAARPESAGGAVRVAHGVSTLRKRPDWIASHGRPSPTTPLAGATPYLGCYRPSSRLLACWPVALARPAGCANASGFLDVSS